MEKIIEFFLLNNIKVILQKPTIYDQTAILPRYNNFGVNDALKKGADFSDSLAVKYNLQTVDYWTIMNRLNREMQEKDSSATITCEDRIHPRHTGHFVMAYQFLKTENAPKYVSKIVIDSKKEKSTPESENCEINEITKLDNGLSFTVIENALPFPTIEEQEKALQLVPFMDELNVELLQILNLKQGQFKLSIDNVEIGNFTAEQFAQGINLAEFQETPQYQQAKQLLAILEKLWEKESALRSIKFIEYNPHYKNIPNKENLNNVGTFLDSAFIANYTNPYYKSQLKRYITNKPQEANFLQQSDELREEAFRIAQVKPHYYKITIKYSI